ncbi:hypothetical protein NOZ09_001258 [Klebsiella pneumoniae]|nr:DUF551 domain-containing protein [Klebsiella pneumoniae]WAU42255.1 hypothetical protein NOZ09_001258 [Klebsiella pneumoniae]
MPDEIETIDKNPKSWAAWKREAERLQAIIDDMALAAMDSEPVAYIFKHPAGRLFWSLTDESNKGHDDVMPVYAAPQSPGSEPATVPGKWIPVSERMPEMGEKQRYVLAADFKNNYWPNIPNTQVGVYGDWFDDGNPTWDDGDGEDLHLKEVTHWMPLPAGPQGVKGE